MLSGVERLDTQVSSCAGVRWTDVVGLLAWLLGFALEVTADFQKYAFKQDPANKGKFISTGAAKLLPGALLAAMQGFW